MEHIKDVRHELEALSAICATAKERTDAVLEALALWEDIETVRVGAGSGSIGQQLLQRWSGSHESQESQSESQEHLKSDGAGESKCAVGGDAMEIVNGRQDERYTIPD